MAIRLLLIILSFSSLHTFAQSSRGWLSIDTIMQDPSWMGTPPENIRWSDDGDWLYFRWRTAGDAGDSLYKVPAMGGTPQRVDVAERLTITPSQGSFSKDFSKKAFEKDGDLFIADIAQNTIRQLTQTVSEEQRPVFTGDEQSIAYRKNGDVFVRSLRTGAEKQLTNFHAHDPDDEDPKTELQQHLEAQQMELFEVLRTRKEKRDAQEAAQTSLEVSHPKPYYTNGKTVGALQLSPDQRFVTFTLTKRNSEGLRTIVPSYVTESGFTEDISARTKVGEPLSMQEFCVLDREADTVRIVDPGDLPGITSIVSDDHEHTRNVVYAGPYWSDDGRHAFVQVYARDNKDRWIVRFHPETASFGALLDHQHDDAWIGGPGISRWQSSVGWLPDSRHVWFQSEEDGWSHLYTVDLEGDDREQLTEGTFEVYAPFISRDKTTWYFTSNEEHYGVRHLYTMPLGGGTRTRVTTRTGRHDAYISPDGQRIALRYSSSNTIPELLLMDNSPGGKAERITSSQSAAFKAYDWRAPEIRTFRARDGADVPVRVYTPDTTNRAAVIFVHGAGYLQNAHQWWSSYFREYMFHNLLADKGYTVLDIDYRGSAGLGRDWRTAIYRFMGGQDLDDQVDGARWLVDEYGIDPSRIGMYGGSWRIVRRVYHVHGYVHDAGSLRCGCRITASDRLGTLQPWLYIEHS
jgi:dipeptidyl aminopeptidase/acylaminoacyl peptidase